MVTAHAWHVAVAQFRLVGRLTETTITALGTGVIVLLILLSGFFSSSEIAMFSLERHRIDVLAEQGRRGAATVAELTANPHRLLVTILVGNNLVNVAMSSLATAIVGLHTTTPGTAVLVSTFGVTALVLLFGEAAPKSYAIEHTESWALRIARPLRVAEYLLLPLVVLFDHLTRAVNRIVGGHPPADARSVSRDEIREVIRTGEREGVLEEAERARLDRIFQLSQTPVAELMTPLDAVSTVATDSGIDDAVGTVTSTNREHIPVYDDETDALGGIVTIHDLARAAYGTEEVELRTLVRPTIHAHRSRNVADLLGEMQDSRVRLAIVVDDDGRAEGVVTIDDMVEGLRGGMRRPSAAP